MLLQEWLQLLMRKALPAEATVEVPKSHPQTWPTRVKLVRQAWFAETMSALKQQLIVLLHAHPTERERLQLLKQVLE
jgi:hypothetical protein